MVGSQRLVLTVGLSFALLTGGGVAAASAPEKSSGARAAAVSAVPVVPPPPVEAGPTDVPHGPPSVPTVVAGSADVDVVPAGTRKAKGRPAPSAGSIVDVEYENGFTPAVPTRVRVETADEDVASSRGGNKLAFRVSRLDAGLDDTPVVVSIDYRSLRQSFGAHWDERLQLVQLGDCSLSRTVSKCDQTATVVTGFTNDVANGEIQAKLVIPSAGKTKPVTPGNPTVLTSVTSTTLSSTTPTSTSVTSTTVPSTTTSTSVPSTTVISTSSTSPSVPLSSSSSGVPAETSVTAPADVVSKVTTPLPSFSTSSASSTSTTSSTVVAAAARSAAPVGVCQINCVSGS
jgi:hypothetical protein